MNDLISRQAVLNRITESINQFGGRYTTDQLNMWGLFTQMIIDLPPSQQKPLKYIGESICLYCRSADCEGCMYEPMEGVQ